MDSRRVWARRGTELGQERLGSLALLAVADVGDALTRAAAVVGEACSETVLGERQEHGREVLWRRTRDGRELEEDGRQPAPLHCLEQRPQHLCIVAISVA